MGTPKKGTSETHQIRISNVARQNIDDIIRYIAFVNEQPLNAIKVSEAIESTITKIAEHPYAYKECEQLPTKTKIYRQAVCLSWLIIYRISSTEILILSIIHGARSPKKIGMLRKIK
jgi:plasmid stabilization system protein ParE